MKDVNVEGYMSFIIQMNPHIGSVMDVIISKLYQINSPLH